MSKSILFSVLMVLALCGLSSAQYGYGGGDHYGHGGHGGYGVGYGYVSAGFGHPTNHHHQPQFGIAKVQVQQNPHHYQYSVQESGPYYHKQVHQSAVTRHHHVPVAVAAVPAYGGFHGAPYGAAYGHGHGAGIGDYGYGHGPIGVRGAY